MMTMRHCVHVFRSPLFSVRNNLMSYLRDGPSFGYEL